MSKSKRELELEAEIFNMNLSFKNKIEELETLLGQRNEQVKELRSKLENYDKEMLYSKTDKETIKKILSLFASGNTYKSIREKLKYNRMESDIEFIKTICQNIDDLDNDLILYYKEQCKAYEDSIKINPEILKDNMIKLYQNLINDATMDLDNITDTEEKRKIREEIDKRADKINNVLKNIIDDKNNKENNKKEQIDNVMDIYKSKIISFKAVKKEEEVDVNG